MAVITLSQIVSRHDELLNRLQEQARIASSNRVGASADIVRGKERMLASLNDRTSQAKKARQKELERRDAEIAALSARAKSLKAEIRRDKEDIARGGRGKKAPAGPVGEKQQAGLTRIKGIGKVAAAKLQDRGIHDAAGVARLRPEALAEILDTSDKRARDIIAAARGRK